MNILLLEEYPEIKREYLKYLEKKHNIFELKDNFENDDIEIVIIRSKIKVDKKLLDNYPNLKFVARVGVGLDKIDLKECKKRKIKVLERKCFDKLGTEEQEKLLEKYENIRKELIKMIKDINSKKVKLSSNDFKSGLFSEVIGETLNGDIDDIDPITDLFFD